MCLEYADDLTLLAETPASLQVALEIIARWARDWGMRVNTSAGKTEVTDGTALQSCGTQEVPPYVP